VTVEAGPAKQELLITLLDRRKHDRDSFSCGVTRLDNFLKQSARKQQAGNFTKVWVATLTGRSGIAGSCALNAQDRAMGRS